MAPAFLTTQAYLVPKPRPIQIQTLSHSVCRSFLDRSFRRPQHPTATHISVALSLCNRLLAHLASRFTQLHLPCYYSIALHPLTYTPATRAHLTPCYSLTPGKPQLHPQANPKKLTSNARTQHYSITTGRRITREEAARSSADYCEISFKHCISLSRTACCHPYSSVAGLARLS